MFSHLKPFCFGRFAVVFVFALSLLIAQTGFANSIETHEFDTEAKRQLYNQLSQELRCPKCQNQNIADSNSQIAIDLRNQVARLVSENQSEQEIKDYMVNRYGDFVLYEPPLKPGTFLLWFGPLFMAVLGVAIFVLSILKRKKNATQNDLEQA